MNRLARHLASVARCLVALATLAATPLAAWADPPSDIDIYAGFNGTADRPNVLIVLDSSANWAASITGAANCFYRDNGVTTTNGPGADQGTKLGIEKCALYNLVDALPVASSGGPSGNALFNVGIMLMNEPNNDGAYPRYAIQPLTSNNKATLKALIAGLTKNGDKGNNADYGQSLYEAYLYFKNMAPLNGTKGTKFDSAAFSGGKYVSPSNNSCGRNYIIVIGNGSPQNSNPEKSVESLMGTRIDIDLASLSATDRAALKARISNASLGNDAANWSDEMARFMRLVDVSGKVDVQGIITHAIAVTKGPSDGDFPALMNSIASYGGGNYFEARSADVLVQQLLDIFNQIQAVNSVFASASLPVSVNARGTYLNQIFMGMFRPDGDGKPRWRGNLKQYQFALDALDNLYIADSTFNTTTNTWNPAISSTTGFISPSAVSFWTTNSTFWANAPMGTPASSSDSPDGEVVEKGSVAQRLRTTFATSQADRKIYTCVGCAANTALGGTSATQFIADNTAITQDLLGVGNATARTNLINWVRGADNNNDEKGPGGTTTVRPSIHGDVLHSRPAVVNYGGTTGVVVYYGANDGQLRAVNGNQTGTGAGEELWSFIPEEHFGKLKRLRDNTPDVQMSTTPASLLATPRDYFVDGPIGVYQKFNSSGGVDRVIIYVGMRRGGRLLYAFDVTSPTAPRMLWRVSNASTGMSRLGQTWSEPRVARVKGRTNPVLIMGGGYDAQAEDHSAAVTMGNAVFVLDAIDGSVVKEFTSLSGVATVSSIGRPVAADVTILDTNGDGFIDRAYAADLGGQIYRIDFENGTSNAVADWTVHKVADLSGGTSTGRKFFYPPDAIVTKNFTALMIGSGDREKPLLTATQDHFFQVFDRRTVPGAPSLATPVVWADLVATGSSSSTTGGGCYQALDQGEKAVNAATSIGGQTFFGTNKPKASSANVCSANLGEAKVYAMPLFCVAATGTVLEGGGLPPSPVAGIVNITRPDGTTKQVPFVIGAPNARKSAIEGSRLNPTIQVPRKRRYWYEESAR